MVFNNKQNNAKKTRQTVKLLQGLSKKIFFKKLDKSKFKINPILRKK